MSAIQITPSAERPAAAESPDRVTFWADAARRVMATRGGIDFPIDGAFLHVPLRASSFALSGTSHARHIPVTGGVTIAVPPAGADYQDFACRIVNRGSGTVTLAGGIAAEIPGGAGGLLVCDGSVWDIIASAVATTGTAAITAGLFRKADRTAPVFTKTGAATMNLKAGTIVECADVIFNFQAATAVLMPTLSPGLDYAVFMCADGSVRADASFSAPVGYTSATSRRIGNFHFDLGSAILAPSICDLAWHPACRDWRGMTLVPGGGVWADIYLLNTDPSVLGTSRAGVTIADGSSPPTVPTAFGGTGSNRYSTLTRFEAAEVLRAFGKRLPRYEEFAAFAYGSTEASSCGTDPVTTGRTSGFTSLCGGEQATGCMWIWGLEFGGTYDTSAAWQANTGGRGSAHAQPSATLFGGHWGGLALSGSRASAWNNGPSASAPSTGARGFCDHINLGV